MSEKRTIIIHVKEDCPYEQRLIDGLFAGFKPGRHTLTLERKNHRTLNQNAYQHLLFSLCVKGLYDAGYEQIRTAEQAKEFIKAELLPYDVVNKKTGEVRHMVKATSSLTKEENSVFIDELLRWAMQELNIYLPSPDDYMKNAERWESLTNNVYQ